jgi:Putative MetA-pathway of phenol degradation
LTNRLIFLFLILATIYSNAQSTIQTDRPDQTESPYIVPSRYIQIETGLLFEKIKNETFVFTTPTILWKYGVNQNFELRLITEYATMQENENSNSNFSPITIGFKSSLSEEKGVFPKTSFIGHITAPCTDKKIYFEPSFRFTMQHTLSDMFSLSYNLGAEWEKKSLETTYIYTLTLGTSLSNRFGCYMELYGFHSESKPNDHNIDFGFTYLANNDLLFDLSKSVGITENAIHSYWNIGCSLRFTAFK